MNPLPFIAMAANCTLGSFYGQITHDWYLWCANTIGVLLSESQRAAQSALWGPAHNAAASVDVGIYHQWHFCQMNI